MKLLDPENRWEPCCEATLDELFEEITFTPYGNEVVGPRAGWLFLSNIGVSHGGGWHYVKFKQALCELLSCSIYGNDPTTIHEHHFLQLVSQQDGTVKLFLKFQQILGSYCLTLMDEAEAIAWLERAKEIAA